MSNLSLRLWSPTATILVALGALSVSACGTEIIYPNGEGGTANSGGNTGGNTGGNNTGGNTGGNNTGGNNTGGNNTGGGSGIDCVNANNGDPCGSPGSYCSYFDAGINEYCDGWCDDSFHWQKSCYTQPTYCYQPPNLCPSSPPVNGTYCPSTDDCEYYDCEFYGACGGSGYGQASCQDNVWYVYNDCYCYQPPNLCPATPPADGSPCTTTQQCQNYDCEWINTCGTNTYHYAYCDQNGTWYSDGQCN